VLIRIDMLDVKKGEPGAPVLRFLETPATAIDLENESGGTPPQKRKREG
jgi:hypothetical protein